MSSFPTVLHTGYY